MPLLSIFKSKKPKSPKYFLTVDINAGDVKCIIFEIVPKEVSGNGETVAKAIGAGRQPLEQNVVRGGIIFDLEAIEDALTLAIKKSLYELDAGVKHVVFGVGGDISLGLMTTARVGRASNAPIVQKEVDDIYKKVMDVALARAQMEFLQTTGETDVDLDIVTRSTAYMKVDDETVLNSVGLNGRKVELAVFTAFAPKFHTKMLFGLSKKLRLNILAAGSYMYAVSTLLKRSGKENVNYVIVNVGGDSTDVGVVFGGSVVFTKSFPIGVTQFANAVAQKRGLAYVEAMGSLRKYACGELDESRAQLVSKAIEDVLGIWLEGIELLFSEFSGVKTFSPVLYLTGGGFDIPDVYDMFSNEPWTKSIPFKAPPEFVKLSVADLPRVKDSTGKLNMLDWVFAAALAAIPLEMRGIL